jgi:hypothetical protein
LFCILKGTKKNFAIFKNETQKTKGSIVNYQSFAIPSREYNNARKVDREQRWISERIKTHRQG